MMRILTVGILFILLLASTSVSQAGEPKLLWTYKEDLINTDMYHTDVAISADGEYIAVGSDSFREDIDNEVLFFNREGKLLWRHKIRGDADSLSVSADGNYIAAGGWSGVMKGNINEVYFFNREGKLLWSNKIPLGWGNEGITEVAISADGEYIAVGNTEGSVIQPRPTLYLFNRAGELLWSYTTLHSVESIAISADGEYIAAGSFRGLGTLQSKRFEPVGELYYFNKAGELLWIYNNPDTNINSLKHLSISADGEYIAVGSDEGSRSKLYFFNRAGELLWSYKMGGSVFSLSMSADGEYIAAGDDNSPQSKVYFFNSTGELLWSYELFRDGTYVSVSADGNYIAAGRPSLNDTLYFFNRAGELLWSYKTGSHWGMSVSADGRYVVAGRYGDIYFLDSQVITTPSPTSTPERSSPTPETPSYEVIFAISGLLTVAYLVLRRRRDRAK